MGEQLPADDGKASFQNPKDLFCESPVGTRRRLQTAPLSATATSITTKSAGPHGPAGQQPAQQPGSAEEPSV